jgi:hypothetical protein
MGLTNVARHVIGSHAVQATRVQTLVDEAARRAIGFRVKGLGFRI